MSIEAKYIREDIARAKVAAGKNNLLRTLLFLRDAMDGLINKQVFGSERFEIEALLNEALKALNNMSTMQKVLPAGLSFRRGQEKQLYNKLTFLHAKLKKAIENTKLKKERQRMAILDKYFAEADVFIKENKGIEARKVFRRASEEFKDVPHLLADIGLRLVQGGLFAEAEDYLVRALEENRAEKEIHHALIASYEGTGETEKAEEAVNEAMKYAGTSEFLFLKLASLTLRRADWGAALDAAGRVLKNNPENAEAKEIYERCAPKVFGKKEAAAFSAGASTDKEQPAAKDNKKKGKGKPKAIQVSF